VKFGDVKKDKEFIYMTGEIGDYNPLRTNLKNMNEEIKKILTNDNKDKRLAKAINDNDVNNDLHFVKTAVPKAATEKAINLRISYIGEHGHIYRSITELVDDYKRIKDPAVRAALREMDSAGSERSKTLLDQIVASGKATKEELAIAAFKHGQKSGNYEQLFNSENVRIGSFADVEEQRKARLSSTAGLAAWEIPFAKIMQAKNKTIDSFANMHENVVYRNALRIGNQDIFGVENQENRIMKESFAILDEYKALNTMRARMEQGNYDFDLVKKLGGQEEAEKYVKARLKDLSKSYDAFEWFMTRDVHPIYGGSHPHLREGLVAASFNAGLSALQPRWVDQMFNGYETPNYDNYPVIGKFLMKPMARYMINFNAKLQEPFVLMMRAEDKMSRNIPNPYEIRYELNPDMKRNLEEQKITVSALDRRFGDVGTIRGPGDQLMISEKMNIPYTTSSFLSSFLKATLLPITVPLSLAHTRREQKKLTGAGEGALEKITDFAERIREKVNAITPIEGSAIADSEEKWIAKRAPSHFGWHSGEFGTPGDLPGRENIFWGSGKRQIEPGQMWKMYNLHNLDSEEDTRSLQDVEGLDYSSLSIRKRASNVVEDYFRREQEASVFAPSRHPVGVMSSPLFLYNWLSSTTGRVAESLVEKAHNVKEESAKLKAEGKNVYAAAAKGALAKTVEFGLSPISNTMNLAAISLGGTNYFLQCNQCGAYLRRDAPNCPICHHQYGTAPLAGNKKT
jgi:rubrerythrin